MRLSSRPIKGIAASRRAVAFTLVELLVAVAIVAFLVVILAQIISSAEGIWRHAEARTDAFRDARAALELMSRDLRVALTNDRAPVLSLENVFIQSSDPSAGPTSNQQIYALVPAKNVGDPAAAGPSPTATPARTDICAVGFYCSWDSTRHAYVLRKHVLQSNPTFTRLQSAFGAPTPTPPPSPSPAPTGLPVLPGAVYLPSDPTTNPAEDEIIAAYIWDLKCVPYDNVNGTLTAQTTYPIVYRATLPQFIQVSFKAISPQAARQLSAQNIAPADWFNTASPVYKNQILPLAQTFSTRIHLQNALKP
ncbi:MAG: type II secretion system protein [Chthoniobacterales bacterium]